MEDAAQVVESAAAVVHEAAAVVQETAATVAWPRVERRSKPRLLRRLHEARVEWKHIAIYVPIVLVVIIIGALAIWSFIEKQSVRSIKPAPLPRVTLITADPRSPLTAAWVRLLSDAEMQPTLVPLEKVEVLQGVVVLCDLPALPPGLAKDLDGFVRQGGAVAVIGQPPATPIGTVAMSADVGTSDKAIKFSEAVSPILARLGPGYQFWVKPAQVAFLKESPRMVIDARWSTNARAVIMHMEKDGTRYLWFGFDPDALTEEDRQLMLLLRTAFRWVAGQPVSDGAVGPAQIAKTLTPDARKAAHAGGFVFSVDPLPNPKFFTVRMTNRGPAPLENPTVKVWLPPGVTEVALAGDFLMKRNVTLTGVPEEGACLLSRPRLTKGEDRLMKLKIVSSRR
ncbi:MAG TPA: hypothetical protein VII12_17950 [Thermoanaerobaculia bacterium]